MALEETRSHWGCRPGWRPGRRSHTFHVTFEDERAVAGVDELRRLAAAYHGALRDVPTMGAIPPLWLHLTMQRVGFTDEVSAPELDGILAAARRRCASLAPIPLTFRRALVTPEGVLLPAEPAGPIARVREAIRRAIADVWGPERVPGPSAFQPHVSIAYSDGATPIAPLARMMGELAVAPATVTVRAASLITLRRDARMYTWVACGAVPLGGSRDAGADPPGADDGQER